MMRFAEAARIGSARDFVMELPDNYETEITQMSLSGGAETESFSIKCCARKQASIVVVG
jgi:hypothetical protein